MTDTCNAGTGYGLGTYELINHGDGSFTVQPSNQETPFKCDLEGGGAFSCSRTASVTDDTMGLDVEVRATVSVEGELSSSTQASGTQVGDVTCTGSDCATVESVLQVSFPCRVEEDFTTRRES